MTNNRLGHINKMVQDILDKLSIITLPIKVNDIAKSYGLQIIPYPFQEDISGTLIIQGENGTIGFNQFESRVRRRFTIAHELGHFLLHKNESNVFLDKQYKVHFRSQYTKQAEEVQKIEQEANAFAAAILMPESFVKAEIKTVDFDLGSEEAIKYLARSFDVSTQAMTFRLANLQLFDL